MSVLALSEIFGPTIQGEGPSAGTPAAFVRTAACNLSCVWCDTAYTWDWSRFDASVEVKQTAPVDAADMLRLSLPRTAEPLVIITGGEPMLQQRALADMLSHVGPAIRVEIETAGTRPVGELDQYVARYVVSLKLAHSGNSAAKRERAGAIASLNDTRRVAWKFVAREPADLVEIGRLVEKHGLYGDVFVMPEGATRDELERRAPLLVPAIIAAGYRYSPRLHIELWGSERRR
jgi:organic radical activating enzyme